MSVSQKTNNWQGSPWFMTEISPLILWQTIWIGLIIIIFKKKSYLGNMYIFLFCNHTGETGNSKDHNHKSSIQHLDLHRSLSGIHYIACLQNLPYIDMNHQIHCRFLTRSQRDHSHRHHNLYLLQDPSDLPHSWNELIYIGVTQSKMIHLKQSKSDCPISADK